VCRFLTSERGYYSIFNCTTGTGYDSHDIKKSFARVNPDIVYGDFLACSDLDITEAGIRTPALVLCGTEDKLTPPSLSQFIRDHIPGARLALIEGAGHFVMLENPEAFNAGLTDFVNSLP
jgi:pimeloyl-ACP methyl ester carboxylesterase